MPQHYCVNNQWAKDFQKEYGPETYLTNEGEVQNHPYELCIYRPFGADEEVLKSIKQCEE